MQIIKNIYFYLFAAVGLIFVLIGCVQLIQLGLKSYIFTQADRYVAYPMAKPVSELASSTEPSAEEMEQYRQQELSASRQRQATSGLAYLIVGIPLFAFHFRIIKKELRS